MTPEPETPDEQRRVCARADLQQTVDDWMDRLCVALLRVENTRLADKRLPVHPDDVTIDFPVRLQARTRLLNLKVWSLRYNVTPEFILEFVTRYFEDKRKLRANKIRFGIAANIATSGKVRKALEKEILRVYPNGENCKAVSVNAPLPRGLEDCAVYDDMIERYDARMTARQRQNSIVRFARPFRRSTPLRQGN